MPVTFHFQENDRIMLWTLTDPWNVPDLMSFYKQAEVVLNNAPYIVHSLIDFRQARHIPAGALKARQTNTWDHPRSGQTVVVGAAPLLKKTLEALFRIMRFDRLKFFDGEAEARAYLRDLIAQETESHADSTIAN
ncbi:MAG: hypothetical protein ABI947_05365 [Chloroflexota bacterium]